MSSYVSGVKRILACIVSTAIVLQSILPMELIAHVYADESIPPLEHINSTEADTASSPKLTADHDSPTTTPTQPVATITPSPIDTPNPTTTPEITVSPEPTSSVTPSPNQLTAPEASISATPTQTLTPTPEPTPSATPLPSPEASPSGIISNSEEIPESADIALEATYVRSAGGLLKTTNLESNPLYVEGEVIVKFNKDKLNIKGVLGKAQAFIFEKRFSLAKIGEIESSNSQIFESEKTTQEILSELKGEPSVTFAEPNYKRNPTSISTNDSYKDLLWGLDNVAQSVNGTTGKTDADIDAPEAWALSESTPSIIVAVLDSGVAYSHQDLIANMWDGSNCKSENGSPLGNCNYGYDFENDDKVPTPDTSAHGTHVAGTIAATKGNGKGVVGVSPKAKIMALKFGFDVASEVRAIDFAIQNGVKVINASYGGGGYSQSEFDAIARFKNAGGIFVAAAGNNAGNNDGSQFYPSGYNLDNIISVAATDQNDNLASFSNYGSTSVDVAAPGVNIYSTVPDLQVSSLTYENFESTILPGIPNGWSKTGDWGTYSLGSGWGKVLYGDLTHVPYAKNSNSYINTTSLNIGSSSRVSVGFWSRCDTAKDQGDYMSVEVNNAGSVKELGKWNEYMSTLTYDYVTSDSEYTLFHFTSDIPDSLISNDSSLKFRWITNSDTNVSLDGCLIDDIEITKYSNGSAEKYEYMAGTSMAAPHVAGLAALIKGYNPSLSASQVKDKILTTGDTLTTLSGKTLSGKRVNAYKALLASSSVSSEKSITAFTVPGQTGSTTINETAHTIDITVPYGTSVAALVPTVTVSAGATVSPASGVANNFSTPKTYTVTAVDSTTQAYTVTVTIAADPVTTAFNTISSNLTSVGIANNLNTVTSSNYTNFSGLYFEKSANGSPIARLNFTGTLDLSSAQTQTFLHNLGTKLQSGQGSIALDARDSAIFKASGATILMYAVPAGITAGKLIVRDDTGTILSPAGIVSGFTQDPSTGNVSFTTAHFTKFDIDTTKPVIAAHANVGPIEATSGSGATVSYTPPAATDNIDPTGSASCDPASGSIFSVGSSTVTCNKTDTAGNAATPTTFSISVGDTTAPTVPGIPATTSPTNDTTPTWIWTASTDVVGIDHYIFYWDSVAGGETNASGSLSATTLSFTQSSALATGTWYGKVRAFDTSGNGNVSDNGSVVIDTAAPSGTMAINAGAPYANSSSVSLNFAGVSADVATIELGNGPTGSYQAPIAYENPHAYSLPNNGDGTYVVRVRFTDTAGNVSAGVISDSITLDKTNPTNPTDVYSTSHTTASTTKIVDISWTIAGSTPGATDSLSGINGYSYSFTKGTEDVPDTTKDAEETATTTLSTVLTEGSWYFHLRTLDNAGNWSTAVHTGPYIIDLTKPVIGAHDNISTLATSASGTVVLYTLPTATDNVDATSDATCTPVSGTIFPIGITTVTCTKSDTAGNAATPTFFTVTVAQNPPTLATIGNKTVDELATLTFTALATDPDSSVTYSLTNAPSGATINSATGEFSFTPTETQGPGSYTLTVNSTDGTSTDSEDITITVNEVNVAPVAGDVSVSTNEDTTKNITLSAIDTDIPAQTFNYFLVTNPSHGTLDAITDGKINYTPSANYHGTDSFTYKANDGVANSNTAKVTITVSPVNDAPVASDVSVSTSEDTAKSITLNATDIDLPAQALTYAVVASPIHGTLGSVSGNQVTYTPSANYHGTDSFTYKANDGVANSNTAKVTITVSPVNDAPVATDDTATVDEDTTLTLAKSTLLTNDTDIDGDSLILATVLNATHGSVSMVGTNVLFTPTANYSGPASFDYTVSDGTLTDTGTVAVTVSPVNDAPVAKDDIISVDEDTTLTISKADLLSNDSDIDGDTITLSAVSNATHGTVALVGLNVVFTPTPDYFGQASFDYTVIDGTLTDTGTVTITYNSVNDKPIALNGTATTAQGMTKTISLNATDIDIPVQILTYAVVTSPTHGTLGAVSGNQVTYTPNATYTGTESFTFTANDSVDDSNTATVTITIIANPDAPVISTVATDNIINSGEKAAIHISGTAQANSLVTVTATMANNTKTGTQQLSGGQTGYDITLNGTTALPAPFSDGIISISATATNSLGGVSVAAIKTATQDTLAPTVTKLGNDQADVMIGAGSTALLTFSEPLGFAGKTAVQLALTNGADQALTYVWNGTNDIITITGHSTNATTFANDVIANISDIAGNVTPGVLLVDSTLTASQASPDGSGAATTDSLRPEVVITNPTQPVNVTIGSGSTDPTINVSSFVDGGTGDIPPIKITSTAGTGNSASATIEIPATTVTGPSGWDGVIGAPTVTTVSLPEAVGETKTVGSAIEIGYASAKLSFTNAARILLPGQAGKRAGYTRPATPFTEITTLCTADSQVAGDTLGADGECKIDSGSDLVIWTKHFTKFASFTQSTNSNNSGSGGSGTGSGGGSSSGGGSGDGKSDGLSGKPPVCNETKPGSAPTLTGVSTGTNNVTLNWSAASDPVTYYLITYGANPGAQTWGNPNVGGAGATSYAIHSLSGGTTYYFRIRAGNGCKPGDYSNELSATPGGTIGSSPAEGFAPGVLGATVTASDSVLTESQAQNEVVPVGNGGRFDWLKVWSWIYLHVLFWISWPKK